MFAEEGRRLAVAHGCGRKTDGVGDAFGRTDGRMFELDDHASSVSLCGAQRFSNRIDGSSGNLRGSESFEPGRRGLPREDVLQLRYENRAVLDAIRVRPEPCILPDVALHTGNAHKPLP